MRLYIIGKMRGVPLHNFPAFDTAAAALRAKGHDVISPAELDRDRGFDGTGTPPVGFINRIFPEDVAAICASQGVFCLEGWEGSEFGFIEWQIARALGLRMLYSFDDVPDDSDIYSTAGAA